MHIYSYTHDTHILILTNLKCQSDLWGFYIFVITKIVKYLVGRKFYLRGLFCCGFENFC